MGECYCRVWNNLYLWLSLPMILFPYFFWNEFLILYLAKGKSYMRTPKQQPVSKSMKSRVNIGQSPEGTFLY